MTGLGEGWVLPPPQGGIFDGHEAGADFLLLGFWRGSCPLFGARSKMGNLLNSLDAGGRVRLLFV